jgi:hypothetical protein
LSDQDSCPREGASGEPTKTFREIATPLAMRFFASLLLGYLTLVATSLLLLLVVRWLFGPEALLVPARWRLSPWFALTGPVIIVIPGLISGIVAGAVGGRLRPGLLLAGFVLVFSLAATFTEVRREADTDERRWTPKFTEMIRRVRQPTLAMVAGSFSLSASIVVGVIVARTTGRSRDRLIDGAIVQRDFVTRSIF